MFKVGQRVVVHRPAIAGPVVMAPAVSVAGTITGRYWGDYVVRLDTAETGLNTVVVPESLLELSEEKAS